METNDLWLVNPERSLEVLEKRFTVRFEATLASNSKRPLLKAILTTFRKEFIIGAICQLGSTIAQVASPYILKYLIAFADDAFNAQNNGGDSPSIAYGIGLVIAITALQIVMTFCINHFLYFGQTVGGETRAVLMSQIFAKALRISGRAKAGGSAAPKPPAEVKPGSEEEKTWFKKVLPGNNNDDNKKKKDAKKPKGPPAGGPARPDEDGWSNGRIVNLMSTDTHRIDQASSFFHMLWACPLSIIITIGLLIGNLGYSALPGLGLIFLSSPVLAKSMQGLFRRRFVINKITDQRVSLTSEILQSIRFVKFFGWESSFLKRVDTIRRREVRAIAVLLAIRDGIQSISMGIPVFAAMLSFITYSLSNHTLNPAPIFSSLALFNGLRFPLNILPMVLGQTIDAYASIKRIQEFMVAEESAEDADYDYENKNAIIVEDASFTWERTQKQTAEGSDGDDSLNAHKSTPSTAGSSSPETAGAPAEPFQIPQLNLTVGRSELVGVIGGVGSGKSSLLAALAGDMRKTAGSVTFGATRAFCPQYSWIQNSTVRENITFGREFNRPFYEQVTHACALHPDFEMLPDGDRTEIGERGITVSGGQKQRINIARAIYFNADIILLDDPLSAVDAHVGRHIMDEAICGLLANKCRILATHQLHVLNRCDRIIWLEDGQIKAQGSYQDMMANNEEFAKLMTLTSTEEDEKEYPDDKEDADDPEKVTEHDKLIKVETAKSQKKALMQEEERSINAISWGVYGAYLKAGGSIFIAPLVLFLLIISQGANIMTSLWLSWWTSGQFSLSNGEWVCKRIIQSPSPLKLLFSFLLPFFH